jgi:Arc/MetJ family transcription regulator
MMRTTIDLPDDLHRVALSIARERDVTLSQAVADLLRRALGAGAADITMAMRHGLPVIRLGHPITSDDVRALEDDG